MIDDTDDGDEKKDSIGHMSGLSFAKDGKPMVKPQALASDDPHCSQLVCRINLFGSLFTVIVVSL